MFNNWTVGRRLIAGFALVGLDAGRWSRSFPTAMPTF